MHDISSKITNQLPTLKITDTIVVVVNNRKSKILEMAQYFKNPENATKSESEVMDDFMTILLGEASVQQINELNLPINEYRIIYDAVLAISKGDYGKDKTPSAK